MDTNIISVIRDMLHEAMELFEEGEGDEGMQTLKDIVGYIDERCPDLADPHERDLAFDLGTRTIHPRAVFDTTYDGDTDESEWSHR